MYSVCFGLSWPRRYSPHDNSFSSGALWMARGIQRRSCRRIRRSRRMVRKDSQAACTQPSSPSVQSRPLTPWSTTERDQHRPLRAQTTSRARCARAICLPCRCGIWPMTSTHIHQCPERLAMEGRRSLSPQSSPPAPSMYMKADSRPRRDERPRSAGGAEEVGAHMGRAQASHMSGPDPRRRAERVT